MMLYTDELLSLADLVINLLILFPLAVMYWRGSWQLQQIYFDVVALGAWVSLVLGAVLGTLALLIQPRVTSSMNELMTSCPVACTVMCRVHLYVYSWTLQCYWRGVWTLLDVWLMTDWVNSMVTYVVCHVVLVVTGTTTVSVGIPVNIHLDIHFANSVQPQVISRRSTSASKLLYVADCFLTQFITITSTICVWRGIWNLLEVFVYPVSPLRSDVICLIVGLVSFMSIQLLKTPLVDILRRHPLTRVSRVAVDEVVLVFLIWTTVMMWRGASQLCIVYLLPPNAVDGSAMTGAWVTHILGAGGLILLRTFSSVALPGARRHGDDDVTDDIAFCHNKYLRALLTRRHQKDYVSSDELTQSNSDVSALDRDTMIYTSPAVLINTTVDVIKSHDTKDQQLLTSSETCLPIPIILPPDGGVIASPGDVLVMTTPVEATQSVAVVEADILPLLGVAVVATDLMHQLSNAR